MVLTPAVVVQPQADVPEYTDEWPDGWPRHAGDSRPKIRTLEDPTRLRYYRRPSSYGDKIEDTFMLDRREDRLVMAEMARSPDLVDATWAALHAAPVPGGLDLRDLLVNTYPAEDELAKASAKTIRDALNAVRTDLLKRVGADAKATRGTAIHKLWERKHAGQDLAFLPPVLHECVRAYDRLLADFVVHTMELRVVNDRSGTAGTTDVVVSPRRPMTINGVDLCPDDVLIGDGKTGAHITGLGRVARAIQLDQYVGAQPYVHVSDEAAADGDDGRRTWRQVGVPCDPRDDVALIFHVPQDSPQDAGIYALRLDTARRLSRCADEVWWARGLKPVDLFVPVELDRPDVAPAETPDVEPEPTPERDDRFNVVEMERKLGPYAQDEPEQPRAPRFERSTAGAPSDPHLRAATALAMIRAAESPELLTAVHASTGDVWTALHRAEADRRLVELAARVLR
jgi:hypothetical protein